VHRQIRLVGAVHADHTEEMRVRSGKGAERHQGQGAWRIGQSHQFDKACASLRPGIDQAAAPVKERPLCRADHRDRFGDPVLIGPKLRAVAFVMSLLRLAIRTGRKQNVFWQIDDDRSRPTALRDIEGLVHHARQFAHILDQVVMLGAGPRDAGSIGFLEGVVADQMRRHLARQADDRNRIHQRVGEPGDRICRTGTARHQHHADPAGRARIALGRMDSALLVTHQDVAQRILFEQRIVNRQDRAAWIAENDLDALIDEGANDDLCSAQRFGRHNSLLSRQ